MNIHDCRVGRRVVADQWLSNGDVQQRDGRGQRVRLLRVWRRLLLLVGRRGAADRALLGGLLLYGGRKDPAPVPLWPRWVGCGEKNGGKTGENGKKERKRINKQLEQ